MDAGNKNSKGIQNRRDLICGSTSAFKLPIKISTIYEWRILGLVMLKMQADFGDHRFNFKNKEDLKYQKPLLDQIRFNKRTFGSQYRSDEVEVMFPLDFMLNRDERGKLRGYDQVRKALRSLSRTVEYENKALKEKMFDKSCKDSGIIWGLAQVIEKPDIRMTNGVKCVYFRVPESTWEVLCHWESGIHVFELSVFFKFKRPASASFYVLLADYRKKGEVVWPTNYLKERIAPGEYRDYSLFKSKVIDKVVVELQEHSPFYFEATEYVDKDCLIPAKRGRGMAANFVKIRIIYQKNKNIMLYSNFVGRIGKDGCKVVNGPKGDFISMDVATDFYSKGENKTQWIRVRSSRDNHIKLAQYLTKGKLILVQGSQLEDSRWIGKDGEAHSQHVIIADSIDFIRTGKKKEDANGQQQQNQSEQVEAAPAADTPFPAPADNSDDLPF